MKHFCVRVAIPFAISAFLVFIILSHFVEKQENLRIKVTEDFVLFNGPNPHNFDVLITSTRCFDLKTGFQPTVLIVIFTTQTHRGFQRRQAIRNTWAQDCFYTYYGKCSYVFVFGKHDDSLSNILLQNEHEVYGDVIQESFIDSYRNLTYKSIFTWKWISGYCRGNADYIVKTDDDVFVRVNNMLKLIHKLSEKPTRSMHGFVIRGSPHRHKESKYFITTSEYPFSQYPTLCSGTGVVYPSHIAGDLYNISLTTPYVHLEDVYTSICATKLGISPVCKKVHGMFISNIRYSACKYRGAVTVHELQPEEMFQVHKALKTLDSSQPCTRSTINARTARRI